MNQLGALLLAAGSSSRLGQSKQLLSVDGEPLVRRQSELLLGIEPVCVVVVTGAEQAGVEEALCGLDLKLVHNEDWQQGMGSSIARGISAMPERVRGALLLLCDQWKVTDTDLQQLVKAWELAPLQAAVSHWSGPAGQPVSGPPVIFPRAMFEKLGRLSGDRGAQNLLKRFKPGVQRLEMPHAGIDIDRQSDLADLQQPG